MLRAGGVALVVASLALAACGDGATPHELVGYRPSGVQQVDTSGIPNAADDDTPFEFRAEPGQVLVVYFGYTSCPDVCPTTLAMFKNALNQRGGDAARVQLAMVTIDPARDTSEVLTGYVQSFVSDARALRTDDERVLRAVSDAFGVTFMVTANAEGTVEVSHSGALYVVDETGKLLLTWPFGIAADDVAADLELILDEIDAGADA